MGIGSIVSGLFSGGVSNIIEVVGTAIDKNVTSDEERLELENEHDRAEMSHVREMRTLDVEETKIFLGDVDSAREHQSRVQETENAGWLAKNIQPALALVLIALTFSMFGRVLFGGITMNSHESTIIMMILGALVTIVTQIVSYYFGASRDNTAKDLKMSAMIPGKKQAGR